jgi:hypothetical protein
VGVGGFAFPSYRRVVRRLATRNLSTSRGNPNFGNALYQRGGARVQVLSLGMQRKVYTSPLPDATFIPVTRAELHVVTAVKPRGSAYNR